VTLRAFTHHTCIAPDAAPQDRYLFKPFPGSSHVWALEECRPFAFTTRVLDIGPGNGAIGSALKERGFTDLTAVEIDERAREHIKPIYSRVEASLDPLEGERFGLVLLLDVLEHLTDPAAFLSRVVKLVEPGGTLLVSVPNVAHWSVRLMLLCGSFEYTERGILDKTHYHFFTRRSLHALLARQDRLMLMSEDASIAPVQFLVPERVSKTKVFHLFSKARLFAARCIPGLFGFQILVRVQKKHHGRT
jgi:SAM-dependent methyltransferase